MAVLVAEAFVFVGVEMAALCPRLEECGERVGRMRRIENSIFIVDVKLDPGRGLTSYLLVYTLHVCSKRFVLQTADVRIFDRFNVELGFVGGGRIGVLGVRESEQALCGSREGRSLAALCEIGGDDRRCLLWFRWRRLFWRGEERACWIWFGGGRLDWRCLQTESLFFFAKKKQRKQPENSNYEDVASRSKEVLWGRKRARKG